MSSYPKQPGQDAEAHRKLAQDHLAALIEIEELRAELDRAWQAAMDEGVESGRLRVLMLRSACDLKDGAKEAEKNP